MTRVLLIALGALVLVLVVWPLLRGRAPGHRRRDAPDQLVKDPVCHAYIVRSRARTRVQDGVPRYFCSEECARQFENRGAGLPG
jgi:YHS domain-containing protein